MIDSGFKIRCSACFFRGLRPCSLEASFQRYSASHVRARDTRNRQFTTKIRITPLSQVINDAEFMQRLEAMRSKCEHRADFERDHDCRGSQICLSTLRDAEDDILKNYKTSILLQSVWLFCTVVRNVGVRTRCACSVRARTWVRDSAENV